MGIQQKAGLTFDDVVFIRDAGTLPCVLKEMVIRIQALCAIPLPSKLRTFDALGKFVDELTIKSNQQHVVLAGYTKRAQEMEKALHVAERHWLDASTYKAMC